ncbi:MAG: hypothetical protein AVO33_07090 [delta proteobacterium ML8_F1]|nr:MAG: hypothetical protein AVO33_07090 [delta proteobacterium ML8_F1]
MKQKVLNRHSRGGFESWKSYRLKIAAATAPFLKGEGLVIGPGNGNDLDYLQLEAHLETLTLLDIDQEAVDWGLKRQGASSHRVIGMNLLGFDEEKILGLLAGANQESAMIEGIGSARATLPGKIGDFDTILLAPVLTQLFLPQAMYVLRERGIAPEGDLLRALLDKTAEVMQGLKAFVDGQLKPGGFLVLWNDLLAFSPSDSLVKDFSQAGAREYLEKYTQAHGMSPATYGHGLLEGLGRVVSERYLLWPFSDTTTYLVKFSVVEKKSNNSWKNSICP